MDELIGKLSRDFPSLTFTAGDSFHWSPRQQQVFYIPNVIHERASWSLLHEVSHGLLGHQDYTSDFELLKLEVEAWDKALQLAATYDLTIKPEHIQKCLNTYRDWLHQRSTCPTCTNKSLQTDPKHYHCFNCDTTWKVSSSRFCRPYRRSAPVKSEIRNPKLETNSKTTKLQARNVSNLKPSNSELV